MPSAGFVHYPRFLAENRFFWDDLAQSVLYIRDVLENPSADTRLLDQVEEGILNRLDSPNSATVCISTRHRPLPYYWFPVGNYMVFYAVIDDTMEVRRFLYGSRDLTKMLN